jgi:hypothetical protein
MTAPFVSVSYDSYVYVDPTRGIDVVMVLSGVVDVVQEAATIASDNNRAAIFMFVLSICDVECGMRVEQTKKQGRAVMLARPLQNQ